MKNKKIILIIVYCNYIYSLRDPFSFGMERNRNYICKAIGTMYRDDKKESVAWILSDDELHKVKVEDKIDQIQVKAIVDDGIIICNSDGNEQKIDLEISPST